MPQANNLLNRLSNIFTKNSNTLLGQMLGVVGNELDKVDPAQTNLAGQFAVSTAAGSALDAHGRDWGVPRRANELDNDYRARILTMLPTYTNGPTVGAISTIVQNFTGSSPDIIEYGPMSFMMGVTPMGNFVFTDGSRPFEFQVQVKGTQTYKKADLEAAVNKAKPARAAATFVHGTGGI